MLPHCIINIRCYNYSVSFPLLSDNIIFPSSIYPRKRNRAEDNRAEEIKMLWTLDRAVCTNRPPRQWTLVSATDVSAAHTHLIATFRSLAAQITAIHKTVRALPDTIDFANPATFTMLPFPSPLEIPSQRFEWHKRDDDPCFSYMGRCKFTELHEQVQGPNLFAGYESIYLHFWFGKVTYPRRMLTHSGRETCRICRDARRLYRGVLCSIVQHQLTSSKLATSTACAGVDRNKGQGQHAIRNKRSRLSTYVRSFTFWHSIPFTTSDGI